MRSEPGSARLPFTGTAGGGSAVLVGHPGPGPAGSACGASRPGNGPGAPQSCSRPRLWAGGTRLSAARTLLRRDRLSRWPPVRDATGGAGDQDPAVPPGGQGSDAAYAARMPRRARTPAMTRHGRRAWRKRRCPAPGGDVRDSPHRRGETSSGTIQPPSAPGPRAARRRPPPARCGAAFPPRPGSRRQLGPRMTMRQQAPGSSCSTAARALRK